MMPTDDGEPPAPLINGLEDHYRNPRYLGEVEDPDAFSLAHNPVCGDMLRLSARVDGDRIVEARFKAYGCAAAIAASSVVTEILNGADAEVAWGIDEEAILAVLGSLPPMKVHALVLAREGVHQLLERLNWARPA